MSAIVVSTLKTDSYLGRPLEMFDAVSIDIVMRSDRLSELLSYHHPRAFCGRSAGKEHDSRASVGKGGLRYTKSLVGFLLQPVRSEYSPLAC